jgi:hypothetical protein
MIPEDVYAPVVINGEDVTAELRVTTDTFPINVVLVRAERAFRLGIGRELMRPIG